MRQERESTRNCSKGTCRYGKESGEIAGKSLFFFFRRDCQRGRFRSMNGYSMKKLEKGLQKAVEAILR